MSSILVQALHVAVLLGVMHISLQAQTPVLGGIGKAPAGIGCGDKVQLVSLAASSTAPKHGQPVTLSAQIKHLCSSGSANIPWKITVGSTQVASGTAQNVAAGATVTVTHTWSADVGTHTVDAEADPNNTLSESSASRNNNLAPNSPTVAVQGNWSDWASKAKSAAKTAFLSWFQQSEMTGIAIPQAPIARGGTLKSSVDLSTTIRNSLTSQGVPETVASAVASGLSEGWNSWAASVRIQDLPLFSTPHTIWMSTTMPPTPSNAPPPLLKTFQQNLTPVTSGSFAQAMKSKLGTLASQSGASAAVDDIAGTANVCFSALQGVAVASRLMGGGSTSFHVSAGGAVPGQVINGTGYIPKGSIITPAQC